jgi:CHASE3 domain sensor protein
MDELMMLMKQIRQLSTDKDYDELIEKCRESIYRFEHIAETETPSFGNVF